ncbi:MAG: DUF1592 domain-containing protein [Planctomycetaceae bacterium]
MFARLPLLLLLLFITPVNVRAEDGPLPPFLKQHCVRCHGAAKQNAERRFDVLPRTIDNSNVLAEFQDILDQLNLGEMPPADEKQPTDAERQQVVQWLTSTIDDYHSSHRATGGESILRRLNAREYRNTIRDLLHLNTTMFDPTVAFPRDQTVEHLDNVGDTLVTSGYLLQQYLMAAESVIDKAVFPLLQPEVKTWKFTSNFKQQPEIDQVHGKTNGFRHMTLYDVPGADKPEGAYGPIHAFREGVPFDGIYEIRIRAEALNRNHPYSDAIVGTDKTEPLRLGIVPGDHTVGSLHLPQPMEPLLAEIELADKPAWYTVRVWLDAGYTPRFTFQNGLMDARNLWKKIVQKYADEFPEPKNPGIVEHRFNAIKYGKLPQIHLHEIEITGPLYDSWPKPSQTAVLGDAAATVLESGELTDAQMRAQLQVFASRAYRRPASLDEVDRIMQVVDSQRQSGRTPLEALTDGFKAVLCSPAFLYLEEPTRDGTSATALATRLSYFLWSSMPDERLLELAANGWLSKPDVLDAEVRRMLADEKSDAFIDGFLASWLALRDLGSMPPDRDQFSDYYRFDLKSAMLEETRQFTRHLIDQNLSISNFLDSDFTFVNKALARHYDLPAPADIGFHKVALTDRRRGGLLGQASVLTVTANGIDTSPVVRGVWLLDNVLGTPPSPPPPDVEPLDPDIRGAKTIREQLAKHRTNASCNDCHRKIDPMGFALENFDPIGQWRATYRKKQPIDASGEMPDGTTYNDMQSFRAILVAQHELFCRALTSKLLAYATGRQLEAIDRPHIDQITDQLQEKGNGMADLIRLVIHSPVFHEAPVPN